MATENPPVVDLRSDEEGELETLSQQSDEFVPFKEEIEYAATVSDLIGKTEHHQTEINKRALATELDQLKSEVNKRVLTTELDQLERDSANARTGVQMCSSDLTSLSARSSSEPL